jgi:hypothetical protein
MFDAKQFNPLVFLKYMETVEAERTNRLIKAGVFVGEPTFAKSLADGVGGNYMQRNFSGRLPNNETIYDGAHDIATGTLPTFKQGVVVCGWARAFTEKDFTVSITGKDFMSEVASQLVEYLDERHEDILISILKGIFGSALSGKIVTKQLGSLSVADIVDGLALQGDKSRNIVAVAMHSTILSSLIKANLAQAVKFIDKSGIERDLGIYQWDSRDVIEDDALVPTESYAKTADVAIVAGKVYYTESEGVYTKVAQPDVADIANYYERTLAYPVYLLGRNAFTFQPLPVKVPVEMTREALKNGGQDVLISRERYVMQPYGISFKQASMAGNAPTVAELETANSWELANDGNGNTLPLKNIPLACIVFEVSGI